MAHSNVSYLPHAPKIDYCEIYKIPKATAACVSRLQCDMLKILLFPVMFIRPSSLLPSVDVRAGQTSRVSLYLRTGNFPVPHGVPGLSCSYPA